MPSTRSGLLAVLLTALAAPLAARAQLPDEVGAGMLLLRAGPDRVVPAARLTTDVDIRIAGAVARVGVTQAFRNTGADRVEAVYVFPLPDDAAVDTLTMQVGDRRIVGRIREREQAERVYAAARDAGKRAGLVAQTRPNLFTTSVANVGPGERIEITIEYQQAARFDAGEFSLRFPMTLTPRYAPGRSPGTAGAAAAPEPVPAVAVGAAADNRARIRVRLDAGLPVARVRGLHHELSVAREAGTYLLETRAPTVPMDRDFVIAWRPDTGGMPALAAVTETRGDSTYALLMVVPGSAGEREAVSQPREVIFVVDTSGSMGGVPIEQAKRALGDALGRLGGADRFNVFRFASTTSSLYRSPEPLTAASYREALDYVERLAADGGTEMAAAIRAALSQPAEPGFLRQVVFLTDGGVANETELFGLIKRHVGAARLFTIGIGSAPNSYFMRKAAEFGRGTYTHIGDAAEVGERMTELFDKLGRVALTDVVADWPDAVEYFPHRIPDLYAGEPVVLVGRYDGPLDEPLSVGLHGSAAGRPWSRAVEIGPGTSAGVAALWARRKVEHVIDSRVDGLGPDLIRALVVDVALEHGLVSPYTSLVAVDADAPAVPGPAARSAVASMTPAGAVIGLPQTATFAPLYRWLGLLLLVLGVVLGLRLRRIEFSP